MRICAFSSKLGFDISNQAVNLTNERLANPVKTESNLLEKGRDSYLNQSPKILELLNQIQAMPVQRNKGIDGFLVNNGIVQPIPIKIQREEENFEQAKIALLNASKNNNYKTMILFSLDKKTDNSLFETSTSIDNNIVVVSNLSEVKNLKL